MNYFIIGDVHGCLLTLQAMLRHWDSSNEILIQTGDLIDRGKSSPGVVALFQSVQQANPNCIVLRGNHEQMALDYLANPETSTLWHFNGGLFTIATYDHEDRELMDDLRWFANLPLFYENDVLMASHAGICNSPDAFDENSESGLLWNREKLRNLGKVQVYGHTPTREKYPQYSPDTNSWNLDSGACYRYGLSALRLSATGEVLEKLWEPSDPQDILNVTLR